LGAVARFARGGLKALH